MNQIYTNAVPDNDISRRELKHRALARRIASESIVLLKNDGTLPLKPCPVALFGAGAAATVKGGTGSGEVNERYSVTIAQGLENAGFSILTQSYLNEYLSMLQAAKKAFNKKFIRKLISGGIKDIVNVMADQFQYPAGPLLTDEDISRYSADICIYVIARQAGECADRKLDDFTLYDTETENIKRIRDKYNKVIVVINAGGQMDLTPLEDTGVNSIIYFCQQGMEGGNALADVLTGTVTPSGCLTNTWPEKYEDWPCAMEYSYLKGHCDFEEYKEGIYAGYRYFDSFGISPRYPFGFGLSYTEFNIEVTDVTAYKSDITARVIVSNTGGSPGKKTVMLFVSAPCGRLSREYQSLAAFGKTGLLPAGGAQELTLDFRLTDIAGYDEESACYLLEAGDYIARIGPNAADTVPAAVITLDETVITEKCVNVCVPAVPVKEMKNITRAENVVLPPARKLTVKASDTITKTHSYGIPSLNIDERASKLLESLSDDDMLKIVNGTGTGFAGNNPAVFSVPGAAGNTTSHLAGTGIPNAALCDGPAGVRVQRHSVKYKNGRIKAVDAMIEFLDYLPGIAKRFMLGNPEKGTSLYQYASAFPVGTALAQTWDTSLLGEFGDAIGMEMEEFGCTFWLAPGINIQRNPLCGRNFEYFSEDPLLTGKIAAAITRGVQKHQGCYVTVKHYAANNQENNRNKSDSRVSERALREIYLKGFQTAVQKGGAKSVMTSYNMLNGIYTPNSFDLCTKLLRCEWGFDGVVMTDWFSTGKGLAGNPAAIEAGNDLIMPGGRKSAKDLADGLANGTLSKNALRTSCARVLQAVINGRTGIELKKKQQLNSG